MSNPTETSLLLVGLSDSGKTNFLVALDVALDHPLDKPIDPDALVHSGLSDDRVYLQPLRDKWMQGLELEHTSRQHPPIPHQLRVIHPKTGVTTNFHLPDLAGETFDSHFETRSFPLEYANRLKEATGLLFFVHSDENGFLEVLNEPVLMESSSAPSAPTTDFIPKAISDKDWEIKNTAPQVKLVDLLQFIEEVRVGMEPLPIAVMVSAWDKVEKAYEAHPVAEFQTEPEKFLEVRWPLINQYLRSHPSSFKFRVFGVSARGGGPEDIPRLLKLDLPSERMLLVDGDHRSNDLTRPVRWLLGLLPFGSAKNE